MTCPICDGGDCPALWTQTDRLFRTTDHEFTIKSCAACEVLFLSPRPEADELATYYPEGYWLDPVDDDGGDGGGVRGIWPRLIERYRDFVLRDHVRFVQRVITAQEQRGQEVALLDVGCGDGSFLQSCAVPRSMGMDLAAAAVRNAHARGLAVIRGGLDAAPLHDDSFSLITMFHVLEHVPDIAETLATLRRLLRRDGDLVLQVPNAASLQARLLGRRWAGLDVPRHLVDFTPRSLHSVLEKNGFEPVATNHFCIRDNPTALANSIAPSLYPPARAARAARGLRGGARSRLADLAYLAITVGAIPFTWIESACGRGASLMVHARPS